ncbi:MAG: ABC transporter permease [Longimicrobiales bacterium]
MFDSLLQDLRFAIRGLRKRPFFFLIPVLSLSIGIGANTAIFSAVKRFLLSPPEGIPNASRVVELGRGREGRGFDSFSYPDFLDLREEATPLEALAGYDMRMLTLSQGEAGERVFGMLVSANYFDVLGVRPHLGRTFLPEEDEGWNEHPVVVLGYDYWKARLGGDPRVVGSTLYVSRRPYTVVGIAPEGFGGHIVLANADAYVPLMQSPSFNGGRNWFENRGSSWFQVLGLLRSEATVEEADAAAATVFRRLAEEYPETNARRTVAVKPFGALPGVIRGPAGIFLGILLAFVGLILLITCANVAGIFLARAAARKKEIAIRLSVGSGRSRLIRHVLTESSLIFLSVGVGGILLAAWGLDVLSSFDLPAPVPVQLDLVPDGVAVAFAAALTLGTALLFGLVPAREALKLDLLSTLKDEGGRRGASESRWRRVFVTGQVGASLVLLVAAGLLLRALHHAGDIETGFVAEGAFLTFLDLETEGFAPDEGGVFQDEVLEFFSRQPWVDEVSLALDLPLDLSANSTGVVPEGWEGTEDREDLGVDFNAVSPAYFSTLRIPLLAGRVFRASDRGGSEPVAVVSRTFAERAWPGEPVLGRRVLWDLSGDTWLTIVGVVEDTQNQLLTDAPKPFLYRPLAQYYRPSGHLLVRARVDQAQVVRGVHQGLRSLDPNLSLSPVIRLDRYTGVGTIPQRVAGILAASLGLLALLLSGMGVYGVMAHTVTRRTREMGIRAALGAEPGKVLRSVLLGAFRLALPGLVGGVFLSFCVAVLLRGLLLGVSPLDPVALLGVFLAMVGMVLAGTLVPARRAARIDPAEALRYD